MTAVATIRAAILAKLQGIADIGKVNDFERYADQTSALKAQYVATIAASDQLRGWNIRRVATKEVFVDTGRWSAHVDWRIRGFMALNDANSSEKTFDDLIEAIRDAFRADDTLGGTILTCIDPSSNQAGIQVIESKPVLFAGVLCHSVQLGLFTQYLL